MCLLLFFVFSLFICFLFLVAQIFSLASALLSMIETFHFRIVAEFSLVANPIDVVVLVVAMAPMVSMIKISVTTRAHFLLELLTLPLDRIRFSFQFRIHLLSAKRRREGEKKNDQMFEFSH